jgi:hypothetical protein
MMPGVAGDADAGDDGRCDASGAGCWRRWRLLPLTGRAPAPRRVVQPVQARWQQLRHLRAGGAVVPVRRQVLQGRHQRHGRLHLLPRRDDLQLLQRVASCERRPRSPRPALAGLQTLLGVRPHPRPATDPGLTGTHTRPAHAARFWQCQPPGYTAPPEGRGKVTVRMTQNLPKVPASAIDTGEWARCAGAAASPGARSTIMKRRLPGPRPPTAGHPCACTCCRIFQYELNQKLAADGLGASVSVEAVDLAGSGRRRRLTQAAGTSQLKYTIVVMVPVGKDAAEVGCAGRAAAVVSTSCCTNHWTPADHAPPRCAGFTTHASPACPAASGGGDRQGGRQGGGHGPGHPEAPAAAVPARLPPQQPGHRGADRRHDRVHRDRGRRHGPKRPDAARHGRQDAARLRRQDAAWCSGTDRVAQGHPDHPRRDSRAGVCVAAPVWCQLPQQLPGMHNSSPSLPASLAGRRPAQQKCRRPPLEPPCTTLPRLHHPAALITPRSSTPPSSARP